MKTKIWKITMGMLLCLGFAFSAMACEGLGNSGDESTASSEITDTTGNSSSLTPNDSSDKTSEDSSSAVTPPSSEKEWQEVSDWLDGAQSAKFNFTVDADADVWTWDEEAGKPMRVLLDATLSADMWVTTSDNGADAKLQISVDGKLADTTFGTALTFYYVDGEGYMYDASYDEYIASPISIATVLNNLGVTEENVGAVIETVKTEFGNLEITEEELGGVIDDIFELGGGITNGVMMTKLDSKNYANGFLNIVLNWDSEVTLGEGLNAVIAYATPKDVTPLTYEQILDSVAALGSVSANEAYAALNDMALEYTQMSVQELKDTLLVQEEISTLLAEYFDEATITEIKNFNIANFLATTGEGADKTYGEWVTDDLLALMQGETTEVLTLADYTAQVESFLSTVKLGDYAEVLNVLDMISTFRFSDLSMEFGFKYNQDRSIDSFMVVEKVGIAGKWNFGSADAPNEKDMSAKLTVTASVSEVSSTALTIALPENATIVYVCAESLEGGCCGETNTPIRLREEYALYLCDACYAVFECDRCEGYCGAKAEDVILRDNGLFMCDACYQEMLPPEDPTQDPAETLPPEENIETEPEA